MAAWIKDDRRYCMYCDAARAQQPCEVCRNRTHSMTPVIDAYLKECEAEIVRVTTESGGGVDVR